MGRSGPMKIIPHLQTVDISGTAAAEVQPIAPKKPAAITGNPELSELWDQAVTQLDKDGLLARSDLLSLELCLRHFWVARKASERAGKQLTLADTVHGGEKKNPAEAIFRAESGMFLRYAQQLGLTFASRARTSTTGAGGTGSAVAKGGDADGAEPNPFAAPAAV